jgi:hypothetical protein
MKQREREREQLCYCNCFSSQARLQPHRALAHAAHSVDRLCVRGTELARPVSVKVQSKRHMLNDNFT